MSLSPCEHFRASLEKALRGDPSTTGAASVWSSHLDGCADCRAMLEAERALEGLLASLPAPHLPPHLAARVLARLDQVRRRRDDELDELLSLDAVDEAPPRLASRVLAGLADQRGRATLDELLEAVPAPRMPADLPGRVLEGLAAERRPRLRLLRGGGALRAAALAAGLLGAAFVGWRWIQGPPVAPTDKVAVNPIEDVAPAEAPLLSEEEELLAYAVERWDLLSTEDIDLLLGSGLSSAEVELFELDAFKGNATPPEGQAR